MAKISLVLSFANAILSLFLVVSENNEMTEIATKKKNCMRNKGRLALTPVPFGLVLIKDYIPKT